MKYKLGIDVGGTFTDFLHVNEEGQHEIFKSLTTPKDPFIGVTNGLTEISKHIETSIEKFLSDLEIIVHGTTITTNAALTRNGAKTAFITTKGFRDVLNMRRGLRSRQYDSRYNPPPPFVKRRDIYTVEERVNRDGKVKIPLNKKEMEAIVEKIGQDGYEAIGVSTLFSYINPENEKKIGENLAEASYETDRKMSTIGKCKACGGTLVIKKGKFGRFIACDKYPDCKATFKLPGGALVKPTTKVCEKCDYPMIQVIRRGKRPQDVCINPDCETKKIEDSAARREAEKVESGKIEKKCPKCGKNLVLRKSLYGAFYGCSGYPKCKFTESIEGKGDSKVKKKKK